MAGKNMAKLFKTRHIIPAKNIPPKVYGYDINCSAGHHMRAIIPLPNAYLYFHQATDRLSTNKTYSSPFRIRVYLTGPIFPALILPISVTLEIISAGNNLIRAEKIKSGKIKSG